MRIAFIIILLLGVTGCDWLSEDFEIISSEQLNRLKCEWQDPKVTKWFYTGSADGYHKFVHRDISGDKHYQIKDSDYTIDEPKHTSSNEANWVIMPWGPKDELCKQ